MRRRGVQIRLNAKIAKGSKGDLNAEDAEDAESAEMRGRGCGGFKLSLLAEPLDEFGGGLGAVAALVFFFGGEFGAGVGEVWGDEEEGVVAEAVVAAGDGGREADASLEGAAGGEEDAIG